MYEIFCYRVECWHYICLILEVMSKRYKFCIKHILAVSTAISSDNLINKEWLHSRGNEWQIQDIR